MTLEQLESEVLLLPKDSLEKLIARSLEHLGHLSEIDEETSNEWIEESEIRDNNLTSGKVIGHPANQVFQRLRESLQ